MKINDLELTNWRVPAVVCAMGAIAALLISGGYDIGKRATERWYSEHAVIVTQDDPPPTKGPEHDKVCARFGVAPYTSGDWMKCMERKSIAEGCVLQSIKPIPMSYAETWLCGLPEAIERNVHEDK